MSSSHAVLGSAMTSEESATSRSSASEASQQGAVQSLRDRVGKASVSRASSASSTSSRHQSARAGGDSRKKGSDVWMVAPIEPPAGRQGWGENGQAAHHGKGGSGGARLPPKWVPMFPPLSPVDIGTSFHQC